MRFYLVVYSECLKGESTAKVHQTYEGVRGSSQKNIKEVVVLRSKHMCGFSDHIKDIFASERRAPPSFPLWLDLCTTPDPIT